MSRWAVRISACCGDDTDLAGKLIRTYLKFPQDDRTELLKLPDVLLKASLLELERASSPGESTHVRHACVWAAVCTRWCLHVRFSHCFLRHSALAGLFCRIASSELYLWQCT